MGFNQYKPVHEFKWEKRFTFAKAFSRFLARALFPLAFVGALIGALLGLPGVIIGLIIGTSIAIYLSVQYGRVRAANVVAEPNTRIGRPEL